MKFWDSSAIVPLLVKQKTSKTMQALFKADPHMLVCWTTHCECYSALTRLERERALSLTSFQRAHTKLLALAVSWSIVIPETALEQEAKRLLRLHPLRSADALQLASASLASESNPGSLEFITLDSRLANAASKEGFVFTLELD